MNENVVKFFERYSRDAELQRKVENAVACYPGSLEIRESLVKATLLPIAEEEGFPFTVEDLRKYETRLKMQRSLDVEPGPDEPDEETSYWLLDRGWSDDESKYV